MEIRWCNGADCQLIMFDEGVEKLWFKWRLEWELDTQNDKT